MQIPILNGITSDSGADLRTSYPLNLIPVPKDNGISKGYLHTAEGMVQFADMSSITGQDRGAENWKGVCYRVKGSTLVRVDAYGFATPLGNVGDDGKPVTITYSFDRLIIASALKLFYYDSVTGLTEVTDVDLGPVVDALWAAGYTVTTDGESIVVTDLDDPYAVNPLKYGSSEASPDPINSLLYVKNELIAVNANTIEFFQNVAGTNFPFQRIDSAMIPKGSVGTKASCYFQDGFAFVGGGVRDSVSVYLAGEGNANKIATREIETLLQGLTDQQLANIVVESRSDRTHQLLYVHLPDKTLVFDYSGSQAVGEPVWFYVSSGANGDAQYRARNYVYCYGKWLLGDLVTGNVGYFVADDARQFGDTVPWQFDTVLLYNESRGAIIHQLNLVRLPGRLANASKIASPTTPATVGYSYSQDGLFFTEQRFAPLTVPGDTQKPCVWFQAGYTEGFMTMRFRGLNNPYPDAFVRLDAQVEALNA